MEDDRQREEKVLKLQQIILTIDRERLDKALAILYELNREDKVI